MASLPLSVPLIMRQETNWCWAACAKMVVSYYNVSGLDQCDFANYLFKQTTCCHQSCEGECNRGASPTFINRLYKWLGVYFSFSNSIMPFQELEYQITQGCPVQISWRLHSGGGHVLLVIGTETGPAGKYVHVNDPHAGYMKIPYTSLIDAGGSGSWEYTWHDMETL